MGELVRQNTGLKDIAGEEIYVGDIVDSVFGYSLLICKARDDGSFYGSLICELEDPCRKLPYSISDSEETLLIFGR